jgi:DNA repair protein RadD
MLLRPRQQTFVDRTRAALAERGNTLGIAPTGTGKTVMLSACIDAGKERALVVQHRDELVAQNRKTFHRFHPGTISGVVDASEKHFDRPTVFAMVQTLARPGALERLKAFDKLVIDEAHHAAAGSWQKIIERCRELNPATQILGVTATPNRADNKSLRTVFDNVSDQITLAELIAAGHLVRPRTFVVDIGVRGELANVRKTSVDFDMEAVERIMDKRPLNDEIVRHWKEQAGDRLTVAFASTVEHATHVAEAFTQAGVAAAVVHGEMAEGDRKGTLAAFEAGRIRVVVNVAVLVEGWDCQPVSCVVLLRPSSHKSTMIQMIGRGLRPVDPERFPGIVKNDCVVLDFGTSTLLHGNLEQDVDLEAKPKPKGAAPSKECPDCGATVPLAVMECPLCGYEFPAANDDDGPGAGEAGTLADFKMVEVDLLKSSPYRWEDIWDDDSILVASAFDSWAIAVWYYGQWHAIGGTKGEGVRHLAVGERTLSIAAADDYLREHGDRTSAAKSRSWLNTPASEKQLQLLGLRPMDAIGINRYRAACMLTWRFNQRGIQARLEAATGRRAA